MQIQILDPVCDFLTLGDIVRLSRGCKAFRVYLLQSSFLQNKLGLKRISGCVLSTYMQSMRQRCIECGKYRSISWKRAYNVCTRCCLPLHAGCRCPVRKMEDTRVCLACATDAQNFRFHPCKKQLIEIIKKECNGYLPKKRFLQSLRPRMYTQRRKLLYSMDDVFRLIRFRTPFYGATCRIGRLT